jgi:sterol desaturase/sphingolipid hydroxylase (fatty acid hydroxylase superfamily)
MNFPAAGVPIQMFSDPIDFIAGKLINAVTGENGITLLILFLTAFISALVAYWRVEEHKSVRDFLSFALPKEVIMHPSARADLLFYITKRLMMPFLLIPAGIVFVALVGFGTNQLVSWAFGLDGPLLAGPTPWWLLVLFTITMLIAYDISYYLYHVAQHKIPFLWELHKVHHSAEVLVGITKDRVHPLDELINRMWDGVIPGIAFGLWTVIALDPVEVTVFGINVYVMRNLLMMDFVRHTHYKISFGPLDNVILSPHWHQLHHSADPRHYDKNFGLLLSIWDRMFGTACVPDPNEDMKFGLLDRDKDDYQSLFGLYLLPLRKMAGHVAKLFGRRPVRLDPPPAE